MLRYGGETQSSTRRMARAESLWPSEEGPRPQFTPVASWCSWERNPRLPRECLQGGTSGAYKSLGECRSPVILINSANTAEFNATRFTRQCTPIEGVFLSLHLQDLMHAPVVCSCYAARSTQWHEQTNASITSDCVCARSHRVWALRGWLITHSHSLRRTGHVA